MEKFFTLLHRTNLYISKHVAENVVNFLGRDSAKFSFIFSTNNDFSGKCKHCGGQLSKYNLSEQDRIQLMKVISKFGLTQTDIHQNSNPKEFMRFLKFLDDNCGFDLVVDGPNVTYKRVPVRFKTNSYIQGRNLFQTVKYFSDLNWKVLVIHKGIKRNPLFLDLHGLK